MITIRKGDLEVRVPRGSYLYLFKPNGWRPVEGATKLAKASVEPGPGMDSGERIEAVGDSETDLDKMSDKALRRYASMLGIDTRGLKTREELREAINRASK